MYVYENFWDDVSAMIRLRNITNGLVYGNKSFRAVMDSACRIDRVVASSILRWQPDDTPLGALT